MIFQYNNFIGKSPTAQAITESEKVLFTRIRLMELGPRQLRDLFKDQCLSAHKDKGLGVPHQSPADATPVLPPASVEEKEKEKELVTVGATSGSKQLVNNFNAFAGWASQGAGDVANGIVRGAPAVLRAAPKYAPQVIKAVL